jgi:hypothetical protein
MQVAGCPGLAERELRRGVVDKQVLWKMHQRTIDDRDGRDYGMAETG